GIETASYGKDLANGYGLADLLEEVDRIPGIGRIRLGSLDPSLMKQSFVDRIARLPSLAHHFHVSMQSGSDRILALMKRKYNRQMALDGMERLRTAMPDVQFTTDIIVGFPGETEEDFLQTVDLARHARFLMIHVFPYSGRSGTPAAGMPGQIPTEEKRRRVAALSAVAAEIREELLAKMQGETVEVLFETDEQGFSRGHTASFIEVRCPTERPMQGETGTVRITSCQDGYCIGTLISE
ncbi:MAG: radical SAM protein, partial [Clostridia bacterium]|nr:radical SAM protein [Clostridia bacterium]